MIHVAGYQVDAWFALAVAALLAFWAGYEVCSAVWGRRIAEARRIGEEVQRRVELAFLKGERPVRPAWSPMDSAMAQLERWFK